jgi:hypothetical protein
LIKNIFTSRLIIFLPNQEHHDNSFTAQRILLFCNNENFAILKSSPYIFAIETTPTQHLDRSNDELLVCDILPGKISSGRQFDFRQSSIDWDSWHIEADNQAQLYNLAYLSSSTLRIESDSLALKPLYYANVDDGMLIASRLIDLFRVNGDLIKPIDRMGLAQLLLTGHPFGSRTIHTRVKRTPTGARIEWESGSKSTIISRPRRHKISDPIRSEAGLLEYVLKVDEAISDSIGRHTKGVSSTLNIGLSGGFDSRILAGVMKKRGDSFRAYTYGRWHHREVITAKQIAKTLDVEHHILPYPLENHYDHLDLFMSTMEGQSDSSSVQIANLLQINSASGAPLLHGFMSDAVAVTRFSDMKHGTAPTTLDQAAHNIASSIIKSDSHACFISELVGAEINVDTLRDELLDDMVTDGSSYQSAVLWNVENRQRRFIAGHLPMLGQSFDIIVPFYDAKLMAIWLSLPRICLDERYLQRQQLAKLYRNLATIPHSEEVAPIVPNLTNQVRLLVDTLLRKALIPSYQKLAGYRTSNIWSLSGGMANNEQRLKMRHLFESSTDAATSMLGLDSFARPSVKAYFEKGPESGDFITPRIIFQTASYAQWLKNNI